jgi:hypothetical protein
MFKNRIAVPCLRVFFTSVPCLSTLLFSLSQDKNIVGMALLAIFLAASALSVNAASTTSPPSSIPTIGNSPLPLTAYTFTYPNLVR